MTADNKACGMNARLILPAGADRTPEWYEARRHGVTASEIAAVLGLSSYESLRSLYHKKRGEIADEHDNASMKWGRRLEAPIADEFAERHPEFRLASGGLWQSTERAWQLATPDRRLFEAAADVGTDPVSLLEIKTGGSLDEWGDDDSDEIPVAYRCQVLWQMDTLGLPEARVALLVSGRTYREYTITYDKDDVALMREAAQSFLGRCATGEPPETDDMAATTDALKRLHADLDDIETEIGEDVARDYRAAVAAERQAKKNKRLAENRLREAVGPARFATCGGHKVATHSIYDLDAKWVWRKGSTVNKFTPAKETS